MTGVTLQRVPVKDGVEYISAETWPPRLPSDSDRTSCHENHPFFAVSRFSPPPISGEGCIAINSVGGEDMNLGMERPDRVSRN